MDKIIERFTQIIEKTTVGEKRIKVLNKFVGKLDDDCEYRDQIKEIVESLEVGDVDGKILKKMQKLLKKISDANEPETNDEVSDNEVTCEIVSTQIKVEEVEKELDSHVKKYCGFSEKKPMDYVGYNITKESYVCQYPKKNKCLKNKDKICNFALENIRHNFRTGISEIMSYKKACLPYKSKNILIFCEKDIILVDIQHLISILDIDERMMEKKYKEFSPKITNFMCVKNEFGGYIIRELIPEEVMYEIILSSNSEFSKSFKKDVSLILKKAREDNKLFVVDDTIVYDAQPSNALVPKRKFLCIEGCENDMTKKVLEASITTISCIYLFTIGSVKDLRDNMKIDDKYGDDEVVVKYGRTENLLERSQKHQSTFKKYGGNAKLKYYVWIDAEFQVKAELNVKNYFKRMHKLFSYDSQEELAILTHEELKEVKEHYGQLSDIYCGKLKNIIEAYKKDIADKEKKFSHDKHKLEKQIIELKKDCEMREQLLIKEKEMTKLLTDILHKNQ